MADGDPTKGNLIVGSPLAWAFDCRGGARWALGLAGWRSDSEQAIALSTCGQTDSGRTTLDDPSSNAWTNVGDV